MNKVLDKPLTLEEALAVLRAHADELRAKGVKHAAIFGSLARGEANRGSDIDVLVELDYSLCSDVFAYCGVSENIQALLGNRADVANKAALKLSLRDRILRDAVHAF